MKSHISRLSVEEMANPLGGSKDTIDNWASQRQIPAHKVSRFRKFQTSEVSALVCFGGAVDEPTTINDKEHLS